ncbi:Conserved_hypothetical protein [Hexamita inflata]|uniref:Macro domain-containing protein n=1 Tax=Hexamita inflata TaxID=28002 RepID=A0ABP1H0W2_9EUKA
MINIDSGIQQSDGFKQNYDTIVQQLHIQQILTSDDPYFDQYEYNNILNFTLSGQMSYICLMNHVRCTITEQESQKYCFGSRDVTIEHKSLSQYQKNVSQPNIKMVQNQLADLLSKETKKQAIVGLVAGNNSHCIQPKCYQYNQPFNLHERLSQIMSRCHNADVLTHTSFISASTLNQNYKLVDKPQVVRCKVIRNPFGKFINGQRVDVITAFDPETHGFNKWLNSFIWALDEAVALGTEVVHVVFPMPSGVGNQFRGLGVVVQVVLLTYQLLFEKIYIHPDEGAFSEHNEGFRQIEKSLGFVFGQLKSYNTKYGAKSRAGICLPGLNNGKICTLCQRQRYIYSLHTDTLDAIQRFSPDFIKLVPVANFNVEISQALQCSLKICQLTQEQHTQLKLTVTHPQPCDHSCFCFLSQCHRGHPSKKLSNLCPDGIICSHQGKKTEQSINHMSEFHHASYLQCTNECRETDDYHYQMLVHSHLIRKQCILGAQCQQLYNQDHLKEYWHIQQKRISIINQQSAEEIQIPPGLIEPNNIKIEIASQEVLSMVKQLQQLNVYMSLTSNQLMGLVTANKFLSQEDIRQGNWWRQSKPPSIGQCMKLIRSGAKKPTTFTWLQLFEDQRTKQPEKPKPSGKFSLSSKPQTLPTVSKQTLANESSEFKPKRSRDVLLYDHEIQPFEQNIINQILVNVQVKIDAQRDTQCLLKHNMTYQQTLLDSQVLFLNQECFNIKDFWKSICKDIYDGIRQNSQLVRFADTVLIKYKKENDSFSRTMMFDQNAVQNDQTVPSLFQTNERYENENSFLEYSFTYAHIISQFYASAICYSLYLQDFERQNYFTYLKTNEKYLDFSEQLYDDIPYNFKSASLTVPTDTISDIIKQYMTTTPVNHNSFAILDLNNPKIDDHTVFVCRLSNSILYSPVASVLYNGQTYCFADEQRIHDLAQVLLPDDISKLQVQINTNLLDNFIQNTVTDIYYSENHKDYVGVNDAFRQLLMHSNFIIPKQMQDLTKIEPLKQKLTGVSFVCKNFLELPFSLKADLKCEFILSYESLVTLKIAGKEIRIQYFTIRIDSESKPLLESREHAVGYQKFQLEVTTEQSIPVVIIKQMHSIIENPPVVISGLNMNQRQILILCQNDGIFAFKKVNEFEIDSYGTKHRKQQGKTKLIDEQAIFEIEKFCASGKENDKLKQYETILRSRFSGSGNLVKILNDNRTEITQSPEHTALVHSILSACGLI